MNKSILFVLTVLLSSLSFAQKKELRAADKAIKSNNFAEAKAALGQAKAMMSEMDGKQASQYNLLMAEALFANGTANNEDVNAAIEHLNKVGNDYASDASMFRQSIGNDLLLKGHSLYTDGSFVDAANKFEQVYKVKPNDTIYLYNSAISSDRGQDYEKALNSYLKLDDMGYTGRVKEYYAFNIEENKEEKFEKDTRDLYVKAGTHIKPTERMSESKSGEIVERIAALYAHLDKKDEAIAAIKRARTNKPNDSNLILTEADLHYKLGNIEESTALIQEAIKLDPNNLDLVYYLGQLSAKNKDVEAAKGYYQKVIDMDPNYVDALYDLSSLILEDDVSILEEMNNLGNSTADNKKYDELKEQREKNFKKIIPYLTTILEVKPDDVGVAKTLMSIYGALGDSENQKKMKAKVEELGG